MFLEGNSCRRPPIPVCIDFFPGASGCCLSLAITPTHRMEQQTESNEEGIGSRVFYEYSSSSYSIVEQPF